MAQGDCERVGGVGWGCRIEAQQNLHHVLDLGLVRAAEPHDRELDLGRPEFKYREIGERTGI